MIKKLSSSDHHSLSPPHLTKRSNISYYEHVGQKLSPQDKFMLSIQSYDNDSKPQYGDCPIKMLRITGVETISLLHCRSGFFFLFSSVPAVCYHPRVNFFIHNSYFPTSSDSRWLPKLALHSCGGNFLYFNLFRVNDDIVWQYWIEEKDKFQPTAHYLVSQQKIAPTA